MHHARCAGGDLPHFYGAGYQIIQSPGVVVIVYEMIHEARVIPLDGRPHIHSNIRHWNGDSRRRWEGNTLVVDITNYNNKNSIATNFASQGMRGIGQSERLHVVERFTVVDANTINYKATIDDPATRTRVPGRSRCRSIAIRPIECSSTRATRETMGS